MPDPVSTPKATSAPLAPIPRVPYAITMLCASAVAIWAAYAVATAQGAEGPVLASVMGAAVIASLMSGVALLPAPIVTPERWGLIVLGTSGARTMLALGAMLLMLEVQGLPRTPVVYGILAAVFVLMTAEASVAAILLNRRERQRARGNQISSVPSLHNTPGSVA